LCASRCARSFIRNAKDLIDAGWATTREGEETDKSDELSSPDTAR